MNSVRDSVLGCIVGGAIGDVLGGVRERGYPALSDDTQLTLATCEAIVAKGFADPESIAANFLHWFRSRRLTGLGSSTLKALRDLDAGGHWALCGARGEKAAGNGAAMRIAPLSFMLDPSDFSHRVTIRDVCRITHHHDEAYIGALAVMVFLRMSVRDAETGFAQLASALPDSRVRDRLQALIDGAGEGELSVVARQFGSSGYVVDTVPLAIFAARRMTSTSFERFMHELIAATDDSDTIAAIAGQLAGARLGLSSLPQQLVAIPQVQTALDAANTFADFVERKSNA